MDLSAGHLLHCMQLSLILLLGIAVGIWHVSELDFFEFYLVASGHCAACSGLFLAAFGGGVGALMGSCAAAGVPVALCLLWCTCCCTACSRALAVLPALVHMLYRLLQCTCDISAHVVPPALVDMLHRPLRCTCCTACSSAHVVLPAPVYLLHRLLPSSTRGTPVTCWSTPPATV